jgi:hypothetical protein
MMINFTPMSEPSRSSSGAAAEHERRCPCGSLLARLRANGVELKCRRCKRVVVIPWATAASWHGLEVRWEGPRANGEG